LYGIFRPEWEQPKMPYRYGLYRAFAGQKCTADLFIPIPETVLRT
jgi:hypothetical protein